MSYGHGPVPPLPPGGGGTGGYVPPPGGGYPPPPPPGGGYGRPQQPADMGMAIGALIANLIGLCLCWAVSIIGIVLAIVALVTAPSNPSTARTCGIISWVMFGLSVIVLLVYFVFYGSWFLTL